MQINSATFAAGCFWKIEAAFRQLEGVIATAVGYTGGHWLNPSYLDVCGGMTGHVEAVQLEYDAELVSYDRLLDLFWHIHDPTKSDRDGPDKGPQYRSVIFVHSPLQADLAHASRQKLIDEQRYDRPILTQIRPISTFYMAEEYHQQYYEKREREQ